MTARFSHDTPSDDGIAQMLEHCQLTIESVLRAHGFVNEDGSTWASALVVWAQRSTDIESNVRGATNADAAERLALLSLDLSDDG